MRFLERLLEQWEDAFVTYVSHLYQQITTSLFHGMGLTYASKLEADHYHGRQARERKTDGSHAGIHTTSEVRPLADFIVKCPIMLSDMQF
ncbi:hypothetical protein KIN20_024871 [Parelaphostrongylus tenuis]|uniref:Uncharacterized protein n=1 Tax=Parelaphostrongylus tenuis TaxID=148309 RepID=A0AAD5QXP1_PARTN|nr:hypothetical protein KIN20_024871 [Parelaphostrongylus tenuis]